MRLNIRAIDLLLLVLPPLAALLLFWPATRFGYAWDDAGLIVPIPPMHGAADWLAAVTGGVIRFTGYFRPLPLLSLVLERSAADPRFLAHLDAVLLHTLNTLLVVLLARLLAARAGVALPRARWGALVAGLFFGLHPAAVETVAWLSCRFELVCALFCLLLLIADLALAGSRLRAPVVALLFLLAALSKEMALGLALALPLWHLALRAQGDAPVRREDLRVYAGIVIAGLIYLLLRHWLLGTMLLPAQPAFEPGSAQHAAVVFKTLGFYARLLLWPFGAIGPLHPLDLPLSWSDPQLLAGVATLLAAIVATLRQPAIAALSACALAALLPVLNLLPLPIGDNYAHDRLVYFPAVFVALCLGLQLPRLLDLPGTRAFRLAIQGLAAGAWLALAAMVTATSLPGWSNDLALWTWAYRAHPQSVLAQRNLLATYVNTGHPQQAVDFGSMLLKQSGGGLDVREWESLLLAFDALGEAPPGMLDEVTAALNAMQDDPSDPLPETVYANLARMNLLAGKPDLAAGMYQRILARDPRQPDASYGMALLAQLRGDEAMKADYAARWERDAPVQRKALFQRRFEADLARARQHLPPPSH